MNDEADIVNIVMQETLNVSWWLTDFTTII